MTLMVVFTAIIPMSHAQSLPTASSYVVTSNTMYPTLRQDDIVIVDSNARFGSLKVGDIIVFKTYGTNNSGQHETIVHRVAEIRTDQSNNRTIIRTKGDANPGSIPGVDYPIFQQNYIGKVVYLASDMNAKMLLCHNNNASAISLG
jgi:signal peptidase I